MSPMRPCHFLLCLALAYIRYVLDLHMPYQREAHTEGQSMRVPAAPPMPMLTLANGQVCNMCVPHPLSSLSGANSNVGAGFFIAC